MTPLPNTSRQALIMGSVAGTLLVGSLGLAASPALADYKAKVQNGTLQINGDHASDKLVVSADATTLFVDVGADGTTDFSFARSSVNAINISAGAGDDEVTIQNMVNATTPITIDGGAGDDRLIGGNGVETLIGGSGDDFIDGNIGADTALMGAGNDRFQWDPGDGSDTVEGQAGKDAMDFNGSNAAEEIDVTANGSRVRLHRNVAAITMDFNGVEALNVRDLGGADTTTVGDLAGTDLDDANVDLNAVTGDGDGAADAVVAQGTAQADQASVTTDDTGAAVVSGLAARVHVIGGEPANDRVDVAGLGGDDELNAGVEVIAPLSVHLTGGEGSDTATYDGTRGDDTIGIALNGTEVAAFGPGTSVVDTSTEKLVVEGGAGDDTVNGQNGIGTRTALTVDGGNGDDTLGGGDGDDLLLGGGGDDHVDGNRGTDTALLGSGSDRFQWDPGDGNDTVEGQSGRDALDFNGSNAAEEIDASANGSRVRLTRNVAAITMDLDGIDALNIRALGSADQITLGDLSGTDVDTAAVDLGAFDGTGDGAADTVIQNGTDKADRVHLTRTDTGVFVNGLVPDTTITGGEPANDRLQLNTLGGNDTVTIGSGVSDVLTPSVDLGADQ
jgi:Ca2+-binding RTX toxin-like protein